MLKSKKDFENKNDDGVAAGAQHIDTNEYMSPPPPYPCIVSSTGDTNTFLSYLAMPSYDQAVSNWKESPLEKFIKTKGDGGDDGLGDAPIDTVGLPYGTVLTEGAFLDFATRVTVL